MGLAIRENGVKKRSKSMATEPKYGETAQCTKATGRTIKLTVGDD